MDTEELTTTVGKSLSEVSEVVGETIKTMAENLKVPSEQLLQTAMHGIVIEGMAVLSVVLFFVFSYFIVSVLFY
jgi:hypothetical protein